MTKLRATSIRYCVSWFGVRDGIGVWREWRRSEKLRDKMMALNIRCIELVAREEGLDLTFYWSDGNTEEPWSASELVSDSTAKKFLRKQFGIC